MAQITLDKDFIVRDIINPLANLYGELESLGRTSDLGELEVILVKLNKSVKDAN